MICVLHRPVAAMYDRLVRGDAELIYYFAYCSSYSSLVV